MVALQQRRARRAVERGISPRTVADAVVAVFAADDPPLRTVVGEDARWALDHGDVWSTSDAQ
jgi:hypothetical protein